MLLKVATENTSINVNLQCIIKTKYYYPFWHRKLILQNTPSLHFPWKRLRWIFIFISFDVSELVTNSFFQRVLLNITSICFLYRILYTRLLIPFFTAYLFSIFLFWLITDRYGFMYIFCKNIETPCAIVYRFFVECVKIQGYLMHFQKENHVIFTRQNIAYTHYCFGDTSVSKVI